MCGIVGYIGKKPVVPVIIDGLRRLEYRGYDSAGIAVGGIGDGLQLRRAEGKLRNLEEVIRQHPLTGTYGIGHTRWATHGRPTEENAHPHRDCTGRIVVVHNGIVENYLALKKQLIAEGHKFVTETDTEIIAHLLENYMYGAPNLAAKATVNGSPNGSPGLLSTPASTPKAVTPRLNLEHAMRQTVKQLTGVFALVVITVDEPDLIVAARNGPPAVIGIGTDKDSPEYFVASDVPAILPHTRDLFFLQDGDLAVVTPAGVRVTDFDGNPLERKTQHVSWDPIMAEKGGFKHFMLKEIHEQPRAVRDTMLGRISQDTGKVFLDNMQITAEEFRSMSKINLAACGTSWHAGLAGKFMIERLARVPVEVDYASEWRYRDPIIAPGSITMLITQSGETADTIAAQREARAHGSKTLAICNVVGSAITREADGTIYTHAGPEIGVASTKAFTCQLTALYLFALYLGEQRGTLSPERSKELVRELTLLPGKLELILTKDYDAQCDALAKRYQRVENFLFLGRGVHYPIALEGALKLKEISYIHAEGYPAGEMKHGPNALIDEQLPVVVVATCDRNDPASVTRYEKTMSNLKEVTARSGKVIAIATEGDADIAESADHVLYVPPAPEELSAILEIVPMQLLAYHIAVRRGCDVDQPRNLAKSVTVE